MIFKKGQFVQIRFVNGIFFDAYVDSWSNDESIVHLPDSDDQIFILNTKRDTLLVKILPDNIDPKKREEKTISASEEFEKLAEEPKDDKTLTRMSELKDELNKLEREEILRKARSHVPSGVRMVEYGIPRDIRVAKPAQHTAQETEGEDSSFDSELQNLFSKKD